MVVGSALGRLGGLFRGRRGSEDQPSTEPLQSMVAAMDADAAAHTMPPARSSSLPRANVPRTKKPRVSFNTVTSTTFVKDGDDPFKLSSPQERQLSPLVDSSILSLEVGQAVCNDEEDTTETHFPSVAEICATPELQRGQRDSLSGELPRNADDGHEQTAGGAASTTSSGPSMTTPVRQRGASAASDMALSVPESETPAESPGGTPGEPTGEVTCEAADISRLVLEDEMDPSHVDGHATSSQASLAALSPASAAPGWNLYEEFKNDRSDTEPTDTESAAVQQLGQQGAVVTQSPDTANFVSMINKSIPEAAVHPLGKAVDEAQQAEMTGASLPDAARVSQPSTQETFDFVGVNMEFDRCVGTVPCSSPLGSSASGCASAGFRAPGLGLLASLGGRNGAPAACSPSSAAVGGRFARSPRQGFVRSPKWAPGVPLQQSPLQGSPSGTPLPGCSTMHPIRQLTGGGNSTNLGTRTRMGWEEFANQSELQLPQDDDLASAPNTSLSCPDRVAFECPRGQELHEVLQQLRAESLEDFACEIAQSAEQKRTEYTVAKNLWDRSSSIAPVANELLHTLDEPLLHESFIGNMKEWYQYCKGEAWYKWHTTKRHWLEKDLEIVKEHTQTLRDEVQRLGDIKHKCQGVSSEIRGGSKRIQHICDLQDIKEAYQELQVHALRAVQDEQDLIQRKIPVEQAALEADEAKNMLLELQIQELKQQIQTEEVSAKEARNMSLQQQVRKNSIEKQFFAHTCIMQRATSGAVCLQLRGNIKIWVQQASAAEVVRVSVQPPAPKQLNDPCISISSELSYALPIWAMHRVLALISKSGIERALGPDPSDTEDTHLEANVPCQEVHRFLRLFDVEVLRITDMLRAVHSLRKDVPELAKFSAEFHNSPKGDQPVAVFTALLSVLRSHDVLVDGSLRARVPETPRGNFNAVQCIVKFNADLASLPGMKWSAPTVEPVLGQIDVDTVTLWGAAAQCASHPGSLGEVLTSVGQAMKRGPSPRAVH